MALGRIITGYAAVFNSLSIPMWSDDRGRYVERIRPGAFSWSLRARADVPIRVNHKHPVLGSTRAGNLRLREDAKGLHFELDAPDGSPAARHVAAIERGAVAGMSFEYVLRKDLWDLSVYPPRCELIDLRLREVSLAYDHPAYPATSIRVVRPPAPTVKPSLTPRRDRCARWLRLAEAEMSISARTR